MIRYLKKAIHSSNSTWDRPIVLFAILLLFVGFWIVQPKVHIDSDPGAYSLRAYNISTLEFFSKPGSHIFNHRIGVTIPTGIFYAAFGISPWTTSLWPLVCSLLSILLVWFASPPGTARPLGALLIAANPFQIQYASILFPDIIGATFMFASCFALERRSSAWTEQRIKHAITLSALAVFSLFFAFLAKASAYWALPFWLGVLIFDLVNKRYKTILSFYLPCALWAIIAMAAYLTFCWIMWGSPFSRLDALERVADRHLWLLNKDASELLVARLTTDPIIFLNRLAPLVFGVSVVSLLIPFTKMLFWKGYFLVTLSMWWCGSVSLSHYNPLPLYARFAIPLLPPIAVLAGASFSEIQIKKNVQSILLTAAWAVGVAMLTRFGDKPLSNQSDLAPPQTQATLIALLCATLFVLSRQLKFRRITTPIQTVCAIGLACAQLYYMEPDPDSQFRQTEYASMVHIKDTLKAKDDSVLLLTADRLSPKLLVYYFDYHYPDNLTVVPFSQTIFTNAIDAGNSIYFFIDRKRARRQKRIKKAKNHTRAMMKLVNQRREPERVIENENGDISLYYFPGKK